MTTRDYLPEKRHETLTPGEALRIAREFQGLSQSELARQTGIAQSAISAFESGREEMGIKRVKTLAAALRVHPAVIAFPDWQADVIDIAAAARRRTSVLRSTAPGLVRLKKIRGVRHVIAPAAVGVPARKSARKVARKKRQP